MSCYRGRRVDALMLDHRADFVQRYQAGWAKAHIAEAMGISHRCLHSWVSRFEAPGKAGLNGRSSRPHTIPTRTCGR